MHRFKSAFLSIFQFLQNGKFEPMHEIWKKNRTKALKQYENGNKEK